MNPTITEAQRDLAYNYWVANHIRLPAAAEPVSRMHAAMDFYAKHPLHVKAARVCDPYEDGPEALRGYVAGVEEDVQTALDRAKLYTSLLTPMIYRDAGLVEMAVSDLAPDGDTHRERALDYFRQAIRVATKGATYLMPAIHYLMAAGDNDPISHGDPTTGVDGGHA